MSEVVGTAVVVVRPDTTKFRALLEAQLRTATRNVAVSVPVVAVAAGNGAKVAAAANSEVAVTSGAATRALSKQAVAEKAAAAEARLFAKATEGAAAASAALAAIGRDASLKATEFAAKNATLRESNRAVTVSEKALAAAALSKDAALIEGSTATLAAARDAQVLARADVEAIVASKARAVAEKEAATALAAQGAADALRTSGLVSATQTAELERLAVVKNLNAAASKSLGSAEIANAAALSAFGKSTSGAVLSTEELLVAKRAAAKAAAAFTVASEAEAAASGQVAVAAEASALAIASGNAARIEATATIATSAAEEQVLAAATLQSAEAFQAQAAAALEAQAALNAGKVSLLGAASASGKLDAGLLGLRTALGSSAVIGLSAVALGAIAVGAGVRAAIASFAEFQTGLFTFKATVGATADEMKRVSKAALELGADVSLPAVSAGDAAVAMTELAKAGLSVNDSIAGARGVLQLAAAAQIENADAAELAASALNAFGLSGDQAIRVADDLANAANAAQGSIADMGQALQQSAAVARQVGLNLEDTVSLLSLFAKNGLRGSDAGTSLRTALIRLIAPTKQAAGLIGLLGINIRDAQGRVRPDVFAQFGKATSALSPAMRDAISAMVFGQDAIRAVAIAAREGAGGLELMQFQIDQQGTASDLAAARTSGLAGAMSGLQSEAETAGIRLGALASPVLTDLVIGFADVISVTTKAAEALGKLGSIDLPNLNLGPLHIDIPKDRGLSKIVEDATGGRVKPSTSLLDLLGLSSDSTSEAEQKITDLREQLNTLQKTRVSLGQGGKFKLAESLTPEIARVRALLKQARIDAGDLIPPETDVHKAVAPLQRALEGLRTARDDALNRGVSTSTFDAAILATQRRIAALIFDTENAMKTVNKISFADLTKNLQLALRGFKLDPNGQAAAGFLADARRIVGQISKLGPNVSAAAKQAFAGTLTAPLKATIKSAVDAGDAGSAAKIRALAVRVMQALGLNIKQAGALFVVPATQEVLDAALAPSGLAIARAQAAGDTGGEAAALGARRKILQDRVDAGKESVAQETADLNEITSINSQLEGIAQARVSAVKEAADNARQNAEAAKQKIDDARKAASDAQVKIFSNAEARTQNLLVRAAANESLGDDIKFNTQLRAILRKQVAAAGNKIKDLEIRRDFVRTTAARILALTNQIIADTKKNNEALRQAVRDRITRRFDILDTRLQIAQINENKTAQRRLLLAEIANLKEQIRHQKGNKLAILQLQLAIAEKRKALKDLADEQKGAAGDANAFNKATFEFLQTQQGFAANLFGNLIPGGATGGLVGGTTADGTTAVAHPPPTSAIQQAAALKGAREQQGFTNSQSSTVIQLLQRMVEELASLRSGTGHREARHQRTHVAANSNPHGF